MQLPDGIVAGVKAGPRSAFRVVIAHEDFDSGQRAMDTCHLLLFQLGGGIELQSSRWKFEVLRDAGFKQAAVDDAVKADVIVVASSQAGDLPEEVKKWVEDWVPQKRGQTAALVALFDSTGGDFSRSALAYAFLNKAAISAGMDFLPQGVRLPENTMPLGLGPHSETSPLPAADQIISRPAPEAWGLND